jgi:sterol 24-C-methyltransferase
VFTVARMSYIGKNISSSAIWVMEKFRMMPSGTYDVTENMKTAGDAIVKGGQTKLFTPMMLFVAKKKVSHTFDVKVRADNQAE